MIKLSLNDVFPKGKYKGKKVQEVLKINPKYIIKESENLKSYLFTEDIVEMAYDEIISEQFEYDNFDDEVFYV
jgi:hypothetical protein